MRQIVINGNSIQYQSVGKGAPIIFLHGAFANRNTWRHIIPELSKHYRCILPELPFGGHEIPIVKEFDFTANGIADIINQFIEKLTFGEVIIVANDTGGAFAQVFTAKYPHKVSHLVLSNCDGLEVFPPKKFQSIKYMVKVPGYLWLMGQLFRSKTFLKVDMAFGLLSHKLTGQEIAELYIQNFVINKAIREDFRKMAVEWDSKYTINAFHGLETFEKPVLILWGEDDKELFPLELGRRIAAIFSNVTFVEIANSRTFVQEDNPLAFIENVKNFLEREKAPHLLYKQ